jgi:DnaJ-class molecular chaperone
MPQQIDFDPSVDYYKALGVSQSATADEIKRAYRKLAKANHPDSTGGDKAKEHRFKDISNAYDVLGDAKKRAMYDEIRTHGGTPRGFPGGGFAYTTQGGGPGVFDLGDLFGQFFGGGGARGGQVRVDYGGGGGRPRSPGRQPEAEPEQFVPASDGSRLRVLAGGDVASDVRVSFDRAILGTVASVATIDGEVEVKIPRGTSSGKKLRLRGKGIADHAGAAGDHYVTVQIDVPHELDDEAKKLLTQLVTRLRKREHND